MEPVVLSLGSNIGDSLVTLQGAVDALGEIEGLDLDAVSSVYRTAPWGGVEQDDFLNIVVTGRTTLDPVTLLDNTQRIELEFGRRRDQHWGPRTLDIDLVWVGPEPVSTQRLTLPHPHAHERSFVLVPWLELEPEGCLPGWGSIADLTVEEDVELLSDVGVKLR